jgi:hypothetical protein
LLARTGCASVFSSFLQKNPFFRSTEWAGAALLGVRNPLLRITSKDFSMNKLIAAIVAATFAMGTAFAQAPAAPAPAAPVAAAEPAAPAAHKKAHKAKHKKAKKSKKSAPAA